MSEDSQADRFSQAVRHKEQGEYEQAIALFESIAAKQPNDASAFHQLGLTYSYLVRIEETITALKKAVALQPDSILYLVDLGKAYTMYGEYDAAIPILERAQEMGWRYPDTDDAA